MAELQSPGAGIPPLERSFLSAGLRFGSLLLSDQSLLDSFLSSGNEILEIVDQADIGRASRQVLIPRFQGMEDSSRNWSLLMVVEHLRMVDQGILLTIEALVQGATPFDKIRIQDFKPDPDIDVGVIDRFAALLERYREFIGTRQPLRSQVRFEHPWFGELTAHQWLCLAAAHHRIHRKQVRKINALLGVV